MFILATLIEYLFMKKIAILMYYMNCGGVESALINLLHHINPDKYQVDLYLVERKGGFLKRLPKNINLIELSLTSLEKELVESRSIRSMLRKAKFLGVKEKFEALRLLVKYAIFRHNKNEFYEFKAVFDTKKTFCGYSQVWDFHGYNSLTTYLAAYKFEASYKFMWIHSELIARCSANYPKTQTFFNNIFAVSKTCADIYNQFNHSVKKALVFYNFLNVDEIINLSLKPFNRISDSNCINLVTVGRLSYQKGYDIALKSAKILKDKHLSFRWYFIGAGEELNKLTLLCEELSLSDCITFVGFVDNPYVYMNMCDIYVQPSRSEGYAVTLMEAVVLKKVIVTTNVSGSSEAVSDGYNGRIVNPIPSEIAQALLDICQSNQTLLSLKKNAENKWFEQKESINMLEKILNYE